MTVVNPARLLPARGDDRDLMAARARVPRAGRHNARTEGLNWTAKQVKPNLAAAFHNMDNYQRRIMSHIMSHIALTRAAGTP